VRSLVFNGFIHTFGAVATLPAINALVLTVMGFGLSAIELTTLLIVLFGASGLAKTQAQLHHQRSNK